MCRFGVFLFFLATRVELRRSIFKSLDISVLSSPRIIERLSDEPFLANRILGFRKVLCRLPRILSDSDIREPLGPRFVAFWHSGIFQSFRPRQG